MPTPVRCIAQPQNIEYFRPAIHCICTEKCLFVVVVDGNIEILQRMNRICFGVKTAEKKMKITKRSRATDKLPIFAKRTHFGWDRVIGTGFAKKTRLEKLHKIFYFSWCHCFKTIRILYCSHHKPAASLYIEWIVKLTNRRVNADESGAGQRWAIHFVGE